MRAIFPALVVGLLFGAGLALSDMVNPGRILAFLDIAGRWDPALLFVMGAALVPSAAAHLARRRMSRPLYSSRFHLPDKRALDSNLFGGAILFGIGWGLVGYCPGPAIAALVLGDWQPLLFVVAMLAGIALQHALSGRSERGRSPQPA